MRWLALFLAAWAGAAQAQDDAPRLNDVALVGTHNSYKLAMPDATLARLRAADPSAADALDYAHRPLAQQLDAGARQLEIDLNYDPAGGHYAAGSDDPALGKPGFKVLHIPGIDNRSHCVLLDDCLAQVRAWSDAHPTHLPILITVNAKDERNAHRGGIDALPFDAAAWDALDAAFRRRLGDRIITPDMVQGRHRTLRDAVRANRWPMIAASRGRFILALDETPAKVAAYRGKRRSLEGRAFFVNTDEQSPAGAYLTLNDPLADGARIRRAVQAGYLVRTRADANTREARANDTRPREAALVSGAQYISTDYIWPDPRFAGGYRVSTRARCNPVRRPSGCGDLSETPGSYLAPGDMPDLTTILPEPPIPGSPAAIADRATFEATRALAGTPRWTLATADVTADRLAIFADAIGARLDARVAPALARVLARMGDGDMVGRAKRSFATPRPYIGTDRPICEAKTTHLANNGDYPSGHTSSGWATALVLAELLPDRATAILRRGREFGESRYICGSHSRSAVDAGYMAGAVLVARLHGSPEFRRDMDAARIEVARAARP